MAENKQHPGGKGFQKKGGYPSGTKPASQAKPPPSSISKPKGESPSGTNR